MKKILFLLLLLFPFTIYALTEEQARKQITDYAYFMLNQKKDEVSYLSPSKVQHQRIFQGYKTAGDTYGMDCNAFVGFVVYNALDIKANEDGTIPQPEKGKGALNKTGRAALNDVNGWMSYSKYYKAKSYPLLEGETVQHAAYRINLESLLKPGDLIGFVAFPESTYASRKAADKSSHIVIYVGDGKYIHNRGRGVGLNYLSHISFSDKVGSTFPNKDGSVTTHGAITVLTLTNYNEIPSSVAGRLRYPTGHGGFSYYGTGGLGYSVSSYTNPSSGHLKDPGSGAGNPNPSNNDGNTENNTTNDDTENGNTDTNDTTNEVPTVIIQRTGGGHWEEVKGLHFCEREDTSKIIRILTFILSAVRIIVPILVIISITIALWKAVVDGKITKELISVSAKKIIAGLIVILLPNFIAFVMETLNSKVTFEECVKMSENPKPIRVWVEDPANPIDTSSTNQPIEVGPSEPTSDGSIEGANEGELKFKQQGTYITVASENVTGYYFSHQKENLSANDNRWIASNKNQIDFVLLPGSYYIYARTSSGNINEAQVNVSTSDIIVTNDVSDITLLTTDISSFLQSQGSSLQALNDAIARSAYIAGINSKDSAAASSLALTQILYINYKVKIPYGRTSGSHVIVGVPSTWGGHGSDPGRGFKYQGIHCGGFVAWTYTQAGFKMNSGIGSSGQLCSWGYGKLNKLNPSTVQPGDVLTKATSCDKGKHVAVLNAMDANGYYVTEANAHTSNNGNGLVVSKNIGIVTTYDSFSSGRWSSYLNMTPTINSKKSANVPPSGF